MAETSGLLRGPKSKHFNATVSPKLFQAAAKRVGTTSPAAVMTAALAALATEDELGPWLARNRGVLADSPRELLDQIDIVPTDGDWLAAGELAGRAAGTIAGGGGRIATAFDRVELISDPITAILAQGAGFTVITEDADFDVLAQLVPGLRVLFCDRCTRLREPR